MSDSPLPRTLVIVPALNEAANIACVVAGIRQRAPWADVLVVNDGSSDDTGRIAREAGAMALHMPHRVGIGAAVQTGFMFAARYGYDVAIRNDGDGQHASGDIVRLVEVLQSGAADMVIGSRYLEQNGYIGSVPRRVGSGILSRLVSQIVGQRITDPTSGFNGFNRRTIEVCAREYPHDYPEPEAIVLLHRAGLRICEIPVTMRARTGGRSSITMLRSIYYMFKVILAILIDLLRRPIRVEA